MIMKSKQMAGILALFLGGLGVHHFYLGNSAKGMLYLLFCWTAIPMFLSFFQAIGLFLMNEKKFNAMYNYEFIGTTSQQALKS